MGHSSGAILGAILQATFAEAVGQLHLANQEVADYLMVLLDWPYWEVQLEAAYTLNHLQITLPKEIQAKLDRLQADPQMLSRFGTLKANLQNLKL